MDNNKHLERDRQSEDKFADGGDAAPRARNRTVLLTPEITGQVRARLAQQGELEGSMLGGGAPNPVGVTGQHTGGAPRRPVSDAGFVQPSSNMRPASHGGGAMVPPLTQGAVHSPVAAGLSADRDAVVWAKPSRIVGCLVSFDSDPNGEMFVLRTGRLIVTSQPPPGGSFLYVKDESVSLMHAIIRISETGEIQVLDQLSESGSAVVRLESEEEQHLSGDKCVLRHGDIIRFGSRSFEVCLLARGAESMDGPGED